MVDRSLTSEQRCECKKKIDGNPCGEPARYRLRAIPNGKDKDRLICSRHAKRYSKAWLDKLT